MKFFRNLDHLFDHASPAPSIQPEVPVSAVLRTRLLVIASRERYRQALRRDLEARLADLRSQALAIYNVSRVRLVFDKLKVQRPLDKPRPPASAESLLNRLVPTDWSEAVLGDFLERYERKFNKTLRERGVFSAQMDYWWQVLRSIPGFLRIRISRIPRVANLKRRRTEIQ
jgi:hypothetical protein